MTKAQMLLLVSELTSLRHSFTELLARKLSLDMELTLDPTMEGDPDVLEVKKKLAEADKEISAQILKIKKQIDQGFKTKFVSSVSFAEILPREPTELDEEQKIVPAPVRFHPN